MNPTQLSAIPFTTRIFLLACTLTYVAQTLCSLRNSVYAFTFRDIVFLHETYRCWTSAFFHGNLLHLVMNMTSLISLGSVLESTVFGSLGLGLILVWSILWTSVVQLILIGMLVLGGFIVQTTRQTLVQQVHFLYSNESQHHLVNSSSFTNSTSTLTTMTTSTLYHQLSTDSMIPIDPYHWTTTASIGFSGVLFHLLVLEVHHPAHTILQSSSSTSSTPTQRSVYGLFHVSPILYPWALLLVVQVFLPNVSFLGHASGILAAYIQIFTSSKRDYAFSNFYLPCYTYLQIVEQDWIVPWITVIQQQLSTTTSFSLKYIPMQTLPTWTHSLYSSSSSSSTTTTTPQQSTCLIVSSWLRSIRKGCCYSCQQVQGCCSRAGAYIWLILFGSQQNNPHLNLSSTRNLWSTRTEEEKEEEEDENREESEWIGILSSPNRRIPHSPSSNPTNRNPSTWI